MKTMHSLHKLLAIGLVIFISVCLLTAPRAAHAGTLDMLGQILDLIHPSDPQTIPSGSDLTKLMPLLMDVVKDPEHAPDYIAQHKDALEGNDYGETIVMIAQLYVDVENKDVWGIVGIVTQWLGDDAPCIIAGIILPGVGGGLCDLVKAVVDFLENVGEAIVEFFADLGHAIVCTFKKCCIGGQAVYNGNPYDPKTGYKYYENDGLKWREDPVRDTFWENESTLSNWICDIDENACLSDLQDAQNAFIAQVNKKWDADMTTRVLPNIIAPARNAYISASNVASVANQAATTIASQGGDIQKWVIDRCKSAFSQYDYYDRWIKETGNKFQAGSNAAWCANTFWGKNMSVFAEKIGDYVNQNVCPGFMCKTVASYRTCSNLRDRDLYWIAKWKCQIDTVAMGKELAPMVNATLHQAPPNGDGSQIPCTVANNNVICQRGTQKLFCEKRYESLVLGNLNFVAADLQKQPLVNCTYSEQGPYKDLHSKLLALVADSKSAFYGIASDKVDPLRVAYFRMPTPDYPDPSDLQLLSKIQKDPAYQALGFVTKNCAAGTYSIDGESAPTLCKGGSLSHRITTPAGSPEERLKQEYDKLKQGGPDPRVISPGMGNQFSIQKYNNQRLRNGDVLKVINGRLFVQTKAGAQMAVGNQIVELQDGTKISVKGGTTAQEIKPGTTMQR